MRLFDAHCHLQDERLTPRLTDVMHRAREAGVARFLCCGSEPADWPAVAALAAQDPAILPAFGLHPWYVARRPADWLSRLEAQLAAAGGSVGEIGLDHALPPESWADQETVFRAQLALAARRRCLASVHCRRAWGSLVEILASLDPLPPAILVHSYSGAADLVPVLARRPVYFSFSGSLTRSHNRRAQDAVQVVPGDRLLIETDAPDIMPDLEGQPAPWSDDRGPVNEPANLARVLRAAARLRREDPEALAEQTWQNTCRALGMATLA